MTEAEFLARLRTLPLHPGARGLADDTALVAGLIIGVVESLSAYLIGPVYKDVVVYVLFVLVLWFRPQGLMGKA